MNPRATEAPDDTRRLLVITWSFPPDGYVGGLRWAGITKYLARLGWEVAVVTAAAPIGTETTVGVQVEWCPPFWTFIDGYRWLRRLAGARSLPSSSSASPVARRWEMPGLLRCLYREVAAFLAFPDESRGWVLRAALRTRSLIRRFRPQVVVSSGPAHSAHLVAAMATRGSAVRWLIDLQDPWAGPLPEIWRSHPRLGTWTNRILSAHLERLVFRSASGVITTTDGLAEALAAKYPGLPVVCVQNGVDPECLPPPARDPYPGLGIAYSGRLYTGRDLGPVVRAFRVFLDRHPEAARAGSKLRVAGEAEPSHARAFHDAVAMAGIERYVEVLGQLPRPQALNVVSRSRVAVVLAQQQELQIPSKLYESVAMGIPTLVVAPARSAAGIEGNRVGAMVRDSADVEGIACVLEQLWRDDARARSSCPVPITYEATAAFLDEVLRADDAVAPRSCGAGSTLRLSDPARRSIHKT